jgi:hypothetical protein
MSSINQDIRIDRESWSTVHYGFENDESQPAGSAYCNRGWFVWPGTFEGSINPICLRTWYCLTGDEGEVEAYAVQTWSSSWKELPIIRSIASSILGDLRYSADYTVFDADYNVIGKIDGHLVSLTREFDLVLNGEEQASVRIGTDSRFAQIYLKNTQNKIGTLKVDYESREIGDYKLSVKGDKVDPRLLRLFAIVAINRDLISDIDPLFAAKDKSGVVTA